MARYTVSFDREAEADLASIRDFIAAARGRTFANDFIDRVIGFCQSLETAPHRGTKRESVRPGLRTVSWRKAVTIAFRVSDAKESVVILGVFYRGRDVVRALQTRAKPEVKE